MRADQTDFLFKSVDRKEEILKNKRAHDIVYDHGKKLILKEMEKEDYE